MNGRVKSFLAGCALGVVFVLLAARSDRLAAWVIA